MVLSRGKAVDRSGSSASCCWFCCGCCGLLWLGGWPCWCSWWCAVCVCAACSASAVPLGGEAGEGSAASLGCCQHRGGMGKCVGGGGEAGRVREPERWRLWHLVRGEGAGVAGALLWSSK